jgi:hypothetical protein
MWEDLNDPELQASVSYLVDSGLDPATIYREAAWLLGRYGGRGRNNKDRVVDGQAQKVYQPIRRYLGGLPREEISKAAETLVTEGRWRVVDSRPGRPISFEQNLQSLIAGMSGKPISTEAQIYLRELGTGDSPEQLLALRRQALISTMTGEERTRIINFIDHYILPDRTTDDLGAASITNLRAARIVDSWRQQSDLVARLRLLWPRQTDNQLLISLVQNYHLLMPTRYNLNRFNQTLQNYYRQGIINQETKEAVERLLKEKDEQLNRGKKI